MTILWIFIASLGEGAAAPVARAPYRTVGTTFISPEGRNAWDSGTAGASIATKAR